LGCILVLAGEDPGSRQGNLLLDELSGAKLVFVPKEKRDQRLQQAFTRAVEDGMQPYLIPYGGSNPVGVQGYIQAMQELQDQNLQPDWIVLASSSGGTQAGLLLGAKQTGFSGRILGISVDKSEEELETLIANLANQTAAWLGKSTEITSRDVLVNDAYCRAGYGILQQAEVEAIRLFARTEGILLDPVYTGRAAAGLIDLIRKGFFGRDETVLFWHTGGIPALFAEPYASALLGS
jgi:1-aminocyclopropane-1-carboxylate deaminase/D-cysteine desulfhydrase-like pyridoxal-dependent ACC family enzyme